MTTERTMEVDQSLVEHCFMHFYGLDVSNASVHTSHVRFSPITFRLCEALEGSSATRFWSDDLGPYNIGIAWQHVRDHLAKYEEDKGR